MGRTNSVVMLVFGPVLSNIFFRCHIFQLHFNSNCFAKNVVDTFCTIFKTFAFRSNLFLIDKNFRLDILLPCDNNGIKGSICYLKVASCFVNKAIIRTKNACFVDMKYICESSHREVYRSNGCKAIVK